MSACALRCSFACVMRYSLSGALSHVSKVGGVRHFITSSTASWVDEKSLPSRHLRFRGRLQREPSRGPSAGPGTARPARCRPPASDLHIITTTTTIATTPSLGPARLQPRPWPGCRFPCSFGGRLRRRRAPCPALAASSPRLGVCCLRPPAPLPCPRRARPSAWPPTATTLPAAAPRRRTRAQFVIMAVTLMGRIRGLPHDDDVAVSFHYSTVVSSGTGGGGMTLLCLSCRASRRSSFSGRGRRGCASQCGVRPALLPERCRTAITTHA